MDFTHVINMNIAVRSDLLANNYEGVRIALGVKEGEDVLSAFVQSVVDKLRRTVDNYDSLETVDVKLQQLEQKEEVSDHQESNEALEEDNVIIDNLEDVEQMYEPSLKDEIGNSLFSIRQEDGRVIKLILNEKLSVDQDFIKDLGLNNQKFEQIEMEQDFIIEYFDAQNNKKLLLGETK